MNDRFDRLKQFFTAETTDNGIKSMPCIHNGTNMHALGQYLIFLQEHLHWIVLITAHVLADAGKGEQPMIPDPIMQLSSTQVSCFGNAQICIGTLTCAVKSHWTRIRLQLYQEQCLRSSAFSLALALIQLRYVTST